MLITIFMAGSAFEKIGMKRGSNPLETQGLNQFDGCHISHINLGYDLLDMVVIKQEIQDAPTSFLGVPLSPECRKEDIGKVGSRIRANRRLKGSHIPVLFS